jgi:hypothetical protein
VTVDQRSPIPAVCTLPSEPIERGGTAMTSNDPHNPSPACPGRTLRVTS